MESKNTIEDQIAMNCACFNVRKAARAVTQLYDRVLKPTGLRGTQFTVLIALSRRGDIGISQLADVLIMERTTLARNLKPLVKKGLVAVAEGSDRRTRTVRITAQGQDKIRQAIPYWEKAQTVIAEGLGNKSMAVMLNTVSKVTSLVKET